MSSFAEFLKAYPPEGDSSPAGQTAANALRDKVQKHFDVQVPKLLVKFWSEVGFGYFGNRELYFFGDDSFQGARDSLVDWKQKDFWPDIYVDTRATPVFFAESCFGNQLGWRTEGKKTSIVLFAIDTFKEFLISESFEDLFSRILHDRDSLTKSRDLLAKLPKLKPGMHYAPILPALVGGTKTIGNMHMETANVHFRTCIATRKGLQKIG